MIVVTLCAGVVSLGIGRLPLGREGPVTRAVRGLETAVRGLAFWTAVLLPLAYLPLFVVGVSGTADLVVIGQLVAINVVALLVGHVYDGVFVQGFEETR